MALPLVPLAVVAAGGAAASRYEGAVATSARLRRKVGYGTCERAEATVIIVTEEGVGRVYAYPYASRELADTYFDSVTWKTLSRIMFICDQGIISRELRRGGFHRMPYKTIRTAAANSNLHEQVFVQCDDLGFVSYHFIHETCAFISYESPKCASWSLDDGQPLPAKKEFEEVAYEAETRTFRGVITWTPTTFCGDQRWEYEMVFDTDFSSIIGGRVYHFTPGLTDKNSAEQVQYYETAPGPGSCILRYRRWIPSTDTVAGSSFDPGAGVCQQGTSCEAESRTRSGSEEGTFVNRSVSSPWSPGLASPMLPERSISSPICSSENDGLAEEGKVEC